MRSPIVKRSIVLAGHKTSITLEDQFWESLKDIAKSKQMTLAQLVSSVDLDRGHANLSSAVRLFVLKSLSKPRCVEPIGAQPLGTLFAPGTAPP